MGKNRLPVYLVSLSSSSLLLAYDLTLSDSSNKALSSLFQPC